MDSNTKIARALFGTLLAIRDLGELPEMDAWDLANIAQCAINAVTEALEIDTASVSQATRLKEEGFALLTGTIPPSDDSEGN